MASLQLSNISKSFGDFKAVNNLSFKMNEGEILTLLGPSGCGKSTTLRLIAGFIHPDGGSIYFDDKDITSVPPQNRNTAMVFQSYALWPHMNVKKNVEFGLVTRKIPREKREQRIKEALNRVKLEHLINRFPSQLSGGQQQRVAVARALVVNPDILLLDEPLSNLDAKLRIETRQEIRDIVKDLNLTTIFVTHDQGEALSISDRILVMDLGNLKQLGYPEDIWKTPQTAFVGSFIGEANSIDLEVSDFDEQKVILKTPSNEPDSNKTITSTYFQGISNKGELIRTVIRPEQITIRDLSSNAENSFHAVVNSVMFFGSYTYVQAKLANDILVTIHAPINTKIKRDQEVLLEIKPEDLKSFGPSKF